ncbi:hypothetical protein L7F22_063783 [Adiantum nelumboides]|nr:hypothetical protein [Adiantum nelumboides]
MKTRQQNIPSEYEESEEAERLDSESSNDSEYAPASEENTSEDQDQTNEDSPSSRGKGGELSHDETTIIKGALDLTLKTAAEAMTPIESTFSVAVDTRLDWEALGTILATGHSRVPVYSGDRKNLIGILLVKSLITVRAEDEMPVSAVCIRKLPRVPANTPLYDMLNEFQKGQSHMAAVVSAANEGFQIGNSGGRIATGGDLHNQLADSHVKVTPGNTFGDKCSPPEEKSALHADTPNASYECRITMGREDSQICSTLGKSPGTEATRQSCKNAEGEVIGIITLEDVFEELIQEEIVDETDEYVDVHKRIRVTSGGPSFSNPNGLAGQYGGSLLNTDGKVHLPRGAKAGKKALGNVSSKPSKFPSLKAVYNLTTPLLDEG